MRAYYNENDPEIAAWLKDLIRTGEITKGDVDARSIEDVQPADLVGYTRCHFFAGIAGWDRGLDLARWGDEPVWTGSCPCQPYSKAGFQAEEGDARHLWPSFLALISQSRPLTVFGEQVSGAAGLRFLAGVHHDLESEAYRFGATNLPAACVGAPHIRQRLWWVADLPEPGLEERPHWEPNAGSQYASVKRDRAAGFYRSGPVSCRDGKIRRIPESAFQLLAHGLPAGLDGVPAAAGFPLTGARISTRNAAIRGFGNAVNPLVAAEFINAYKQVRRQGCHV